MKKVRRRRSAVFDVVTNEPETEQEAEQALNDYEEPENRVRANLQAARELCASWKDGAPGSDAMVNQIRHWSNVLRGELNRPHRDPWRIADAAMTLAKWWRDLETNEALHRPIDSKSRQVNGLRKGQIASAKKRTIITMRKYNAAKKKARTRKELAILLGTKKKPVSLEAVRQFERRNGILPS